MRIELGQKTVKVMDCTERESWIKSEISTEAVKLLICEEIMKNHNICYMCSDRV